MSIGVVVGLPWIVSKGDDVAVEVTESVTALVVEDVVTAGAPLYKTYVP